MFSNRKKPLSDKWLIRGEREREPISCRYVGSHHLCTGRARKTVPSRDEQAPYGPRRPVQPWFTIKIISLSSANLHELVFLSKTYARNWMPLQIQQPFLCKHVVCCWKLHIFPITKTDVKNRRPLQNSNRQCYTHTFLLLDEFVTRVLPV